MALRAVAARMGVHLNTVSFQVKTKARLFELMADAILEELSLEDLPEDPRQRVKEITRRQRTVLLASRRRPSGVGNQCIRAQYHECQ